MTFLKYDILSFDSENGDMVFIYNGDLEKTITLNIFNEFPDYRGINKQLHYVSLTTNSVVVLPDASSRMKSLRSPTFGWLNDPITGEIFRPATQMDLDSFEFKNSKTTEGELTDNGKIYSLLLDMYQHTYMI